MGDCRLSVNVRMCITLCFPQQFRFTRFCPAGRHVSPNGCVRRGITLVEWYVAPYTETTENTANNMLFEIRNWKLDVSM